MSAELTTSTRVATEGAPIPVSYDIEGPTDAVAVVFTHGFALDRETWHDQVAPLSESYRILTWDIPGCGESAQTSDPVRFDDSARSLLHLLDEEGVDRVVLVGQSMGSLLNQYVAYHHPHRVRALVHVGGIPLDAGFSKLALNLLRVHVQLLKLMPARMIYAMFGRMVARTSPARHYVRRVSTQTGKQNMIALERRLITDISDGIPGPTEQPQLVLLGEHENGLIRKRARAWHQRHPDSQYVRVPDACHIANQDNPEAVADILSSFLETLNCPQ